LATLFSAEHVLSGKYVLSEQRLLFQPLVMLLSEKHDLSPEHVLVHSCVALLNRGSQESVVRECRESYSLSAYGCRLIAEHVPAHVRVGLVSARRAVAWNRWLWC